MKELRILSKSKLCDHPMLVLKHDLYKSFIAFAAGICGGNRIKNYWLYGSLGYTMVMDEEDL